MNRAGKKYFYVVWHKQQPDGQVQDILDGPFDDHTKAMNEAMVGQCPFSIPSYPTRDRAFATQMYKRDKLVGGQGLDNSLQRMGHQLPQQKEGY